MRLFLALELSDEARKRLADAVSWMASHASAVRVVTPGNYHVTLKFLGPVHASKVSDIHRAVRPLQDRGILDLALEGWGVFPELSRPQVFWAGVRPTPALMDLAARIDAAMVGEGFLPEQRPYRPHVTLARAGDIRPPKDFLERWERWTHRPVDCAWRTTGVTLFQSLESPDGPVYRPIALDGV